VGWSLPIFSYVHSDLAIHRNRHVANLLNSHLAASIAPKPAFAAATFARPCVISRCPLGGSGRHTKRISEFTNHGAEREAKHTGRGIWAREAVAPWSIALALSGVGGRGVCSDDENAHPCEIGQLGIARKMTSAVFAWHYSKLRRTSRPSWRFYNSARPNSKVIIGIYNSRAQANR
jgi:hypothetical protein